MRGLTATLCLFLLACGGEDAADPAELLCTPYTTRCVADQVFVCQPTGELTFSKECATGLACEDGLCTLPGGEGDTTSDTGGETTGDATDDTGASTGEDLPSGWTHLVTAEEWKRVDLADDPFLTDDSEVAGCGEADVIVEDGLDSTIYSVSTNECAWLTVRQAIEYPITAGDPIRASFFHFQITKEDTPHRLELHLGDPPELVWETELEVPSAITAPVKGEWAAQKDWPAGTPIWWHLNNHGDNEWSIVSVEVEL